MITLNNLIKMKINEKNLCAFAVSATPVDKEGYLNKRGEVNKNFQRRYFVLKGNLLFYFDKKGDKEPVGVIILEGCSIGKSLYIIFVLYTDHIVLQSWQRTMSSSALKSNSTGQITEVMYLGQSRRSPWSNG